MATVDPQVPVLIDSIYGSNFVIYGLRMYGQVVVVQAEGLDAYAKYHHSDDYGCISSEATLQDALDAQKQRVEDVEIIQTVIPTIKWGSCPWAYLDRKGRRLIQLSKPRKMYSVACSTWTTLIDEDEIVLTKVIDLYHRQGIWKGQTVEVFRGWTDDTLLHIELSMHGYRALKRRGLDFAHEIVGHLISDGKVVGYVSEAMTGRMVEYCDRKLVYSAAARLHSTGLCYTSFNENGLLIDRGQVKFYNLSGIMPADEVAKEINWRHIDDLFAEDRRGIPNIWPSPKDAEDQYTVLAIAPHPSRFYVSNFFTVARLLSPAFKRWQEKWIRDEARRDRRARRAMLESLESTEADTADTRTKAGTSRATSVLSEATSAVSTVARFHPYGPIMRERMRIYHEENQDGDTTIVATVSSRTAVPSSRGVSLAPSFD
ncbi:uncharacterized protein SCHCODRAFT_02639219 [Schizophyllum commune H4-8]|uniref:uncharacterized protein n=1 Tax=Schizophyllum commune (strain H4-8 / FGSC 9210) TaxID=578458 RepID=UPI0021604CCD|nr:uncharacterized protein SCHCODRAFT_02639219 [Schizophyllum commune H4-8]KAI5887913.1 hypothetical protein SCHCODRAFT_02639219 [Schizophyllum commune H4-8]